MGTWVCGHANLEANELADKQAKEAAEEANNLTNASPIPYTIAKGHIRERTLSRWQSSWDIADIGRYFYEFKPKVTRKSYLSSSNRVAEYRLNRLRLGHTLLRQHLAAKNIIEDPISAKI